MLSSSSIGCVQVHLGESISNQDPRALIIEQTCRGPFSAVSKPILRVNLLLNYHKFSFCCNGTIIFLRYTILAHFCPASNSILDRFKLKFDIGYFAVLRNMSQNLGEFSCFLQNLYILAECSLKSVILHHYFHTEFCRNCGKIQVISRGGCILQKFNFPE